MAHSPEKRAKAVADYLSGMGWKATCEKHGVSKRSLVEWVNEVKSNQKVTSAEIEKEVPEARQAAKQETFNSKLETFLMATVDMLQAWAENCSDDAFIRSNPQGVNELGKTVLDRADRMVSVLRPAEPEFSEDPAASK